MSIKVGDPLPNIHLKGIKNGHIQDLFMADFVRDKKVVLFAVPGAFTPTCTQKHLPSYLENYNALKSKGVDEIACLAVNDPFVMDVWAKSLDVKDKIMMISDGNADFTKAIGLTLEGNFLGLRSQRYVMLIEKGFVKMLEIEPSSNLCTVSHASSLLKRFNETL
ncbi:MAG: peroxiredoxin [Proteobacteria bacterium]|nr:peroxiredoxin [Pseudomonadota bacterium]